MFTVRYPNGQAIQYNTANHLRYTSNGYELYTKDPDKGGGWIATIQSSAGVTVEAVSACRVYDGPQRKQLEELTTQVKAVRRKLREVTAKKR